MLKPTLDSWFLLAVSIWPVTTPTCPAYAMSLCSDSAAFSDNA